MSGSMFLATSDGPTDGAEIRVVKDDDGDFIIRLSAEGSQFDAYLSKEQARALGRRLTREVENAAQ